MNAKYVHITKITSPKIYGAVLRKRLFSLLDSGRKKSVMWLTGPAGAGKTTLVASWIQDRKLPCLWYQVDEGDSDIGSFFYYMGLAAKKAAPRQRKPMPLFTPEYLQGVPAFTRRYFEELFRRLKAPFTIVLDNFQDAPSSAFHGIISHGMETVPEGINVLILSRCGPPAEMTRLRANNNIAFIGWNELRFTQQECRVFLKAKAGKPFSAENVKQLYDRADGWAAGLVLMTEMARGSSISLPLISELSREAVFNYFASEIFDKTDAETRDFLLKTSFFPSMSVSATEELTGNTGARALLSRLSQNHYFTDWRPMSKPVYQYHPLFREFLQNRARTTLSPEDITAIRGRAAALLERSGCFEEAVGLYIDACDWIGVERLLLAQAATLVSQGRSKTVKEWITRIPGEIVEDAPWLLYWLGACCFAYNPAGARKYFEKAFQLFKEDGESNGLFLAWAGIVESLVYGMGDFKPLDYWIIWLDKKHSHGIPPLPPETDARVAAAMFMAMVYRQPYHRDLEFWLDRSLKLALGSGDRNLSLQACSIAANYYYWIGDLDSIIKIRSDIGEFDRSPEVSPLNRIVWRFIDAANDLCFAPPAPSAMPKLNEAIRMADETGVHIWDHMLMALGVYSANLQGDIAAAEEFLKKMKPLLSNERLHLHCQYHCMVSWIAVLRGDNHHALINAETALKLAEETGFLFPKIICLLALANILQTSGRYDESEPYLTEALELSVKTRSPLFQFACLLSKSRCYLDQEKTRDGLRFLSRAIEIGKKNGYSGLPWWWQPSVMAGLCARALGNDIESDYVASLIKKRGIVPQQPVQNWPYPIKIYALGRFRILRDGEPMEFSGKVQQKPLNMLKALIALGGHDVSESRLSDVLWPDAEGDSAHKSFEMTLLRLRRLLGSDEAVLLRSGAISLDFRRCWVDVQAFEFLAKGAGEAWEKMTSSRTKEKTEEAVSLSERALSMYGGLFLPNDPELDYTTGMHEKMRHTALQLVTSLGSYWESARQWRMAIECYRKGIEIDSLSEDFYRGLMVCHERLGQRAEAVRVYGQCRSFLSSVLGIEPSEKTQGIYNSIAVRTENRIA